MILLPHFFLLKDKVYFQESYEGFALESNRLLFEDKMKDGKSILQLLMITEAKGREFRNFIPDGLYETFPAFLGETDDSSTAFPLLCTSIY